MFQYHQRYSEDYSKNWEKAFGKKEKPKTESYEVLKDIEFVSVSVVKDPPDPQCKIEGVNTK